MVERLHIGMVNYFKIPEITIRCDNIVLKCGRFADGIGGSLQTLETTGAYEQYFENVGHYLRWETSG